MQNIFDSISKTARFTRTIQLTTFPVVIPEFCRRAPLLRLFPMNFNFSLSRGDFAPATPVYRERRRRFIVGAGSRGLKFSSQYRLIGAATSRVNARNYSRSTAISLSIFRYFNPRRVKRLARLFPHDLRIAEKFTKLSLRDTFRLSYA